MIIKNIPQIADYENPGLLKPDGESLVIDENGEISIPEPSLEIVSQATGTDEQIVAMVQAADNGDIDLTNYQAVGDERSVSLSAMAATEVGESHVAQTKIFVLMSADNGTAATTNPCYNYQYVTATSGRTYPSFIVGMKKLLKNGDSPNTQSERGYMNSTNTSSNSQKGCQRRTQCNNIFKNAMPSTLIDAFKQIKVKTADSYTSYSSVSTSNDYFFLAAEKEIFGNKTYSIENEANSLSQWEYYTTSININKDDQQQERSPYSSRSDRFCAVNGGSATYYSAAQTFGISPVGCI